MRKEEEQYKKIVFSCPGLHKSAGHVFCSNTEGEHLWENKEEWGLLLKFIVLLPQGIATEILFSVILKRLN